MVTPTKGRNRSGNNKERTLLSSFFRSILECLIISLAGRKRRQAKLFFLIVVVATVVCLFSLQHHVVMKQQQKHHPDMESFLLQKKNSKKKTTTTQLRPQHPREQQQPLLLQQEVDPQSKNQIRLWRNHTLEKCYMMVVNVTKRTEWDQTTKQIKRNIEEEIINEIALPPPQPQAKYHDENNNNYEIPLFPPPTSCKNVFIDLGTNIGDTVGYFIDNAIDLCTPILKRIDPRVQNADLYAMSHFPRPRWNVTSHKFEFVGQHMNNAQEWIHDIMEKLHLKPEDMCVIGMEGNPKFTKQLQDLQRVLWYTNPRFFQYLYVYTEHVISKYNQPTKLYLDEVSTDHNFWGSSLLDSLKDVEQTSALYGGKPKSVTVTGITLSTLLRRTMEYFRDITATTTTDDVDGGGGGGNIIIKMDVEGAEYQVLKEIRKNGTLCEYTQNNTNTNQVHMLVEFHTRNVVSNESQFKKQKAGIKKAVAELEETCGVVIDKMGGNWV